MSLADIKLPPPPSIIELIARFGLTDSERARVYDGHDDGDETPRRHGRWLCRIERDRECALDPHHFGPHEWTERPVSVFRIHSFRRDIVDCRVEQLDA